LGGGWGAWKHPRLGQKIRKTGTVRVAHREGGTTRIFRKGGLILLCTTEGVPTKKAREPRRKGPKGLRENREKKYPPEGPLGLFFLCLGGGFVGVIVLLFSGVFEHQASYGLPFMAITWSFGYMFLILFGMVYFNCFFFFGGGPLSDLVSLKPKFPPLAGSHSA